MSFKDSLNELQEIDFADLDIQQIGVWPSSLKTILLVLGAYPYLGVGLFFQDKRNESATFVAAQKELKLLEQYAKRHFKPPIWMPIGSR